MFVAQISVDVAIFRDDGAVMRVTDTGCRAEH
jgi:hypothetical protein